MFPDWQGDILECKFSEFPSRNFGPRSIREPIVATQIDLCRYIRILPIHKDSRDLGGLPFRQQRPWDFYIVHQRRYDLECSFARESIPIGR